MLKPVRRPLNWVLLVLLFVAVPLTAATLHKGTWTKKGYSVAGTWKIVDEGGKKFVVLDDDFKTKKAPDLKIFLSPKTVAELSNRNATEGAKLVASLKSPKGAQKYAIPAGTDLSKYRSISVHCEKYSKIWAASGL